jgi:hypothetical protein
MFKCSISTPTSTHLAELERSQLARGLPAPASYGARLSDNLDRTAVGPSMVVSCHAFIASVIHAKLPFRRED